ncbi:MAG: peptidylprolyl isomerase [Pseudomonadales bacterium]
MNISKNSVVSFHYRLSKSDGIELESSRDGDPIAYLHGHRGIIAGLEEAMEGRSAGDIFTADIPAAKAYGPRHEDAQQRVPIKHVLKKGKLKKGDTVKINTSEGHRDVTIIKVGKFNVDVDANHPLAGADLSFDIEIIEVREASAEEVSHGHAHGVGGHHH